MIKIVSTVSVVSLKHCIEHYLYGRCFAALVAALTSGTAVVTAGRTH